MDWICFLVKEQTKEGKKKIMQRTAQTLHFTFLDKELGVFVELLWLEGVL